VVVIGIEEQWTSRVVEGSRRPASRLAGFGIELHGDHDTIMRASRAAREYVQWASELQREERPLKDLWVSTKCGDPTTTRAAARTRRWATPSTRCTRTA